MVPEVEEMIPGEQEIEAPPVDEPVPVPEPSPPVAAPEPEPETASLEPQADEGAMEAAAEVPAPQGQVEDDSLSLKTAMLLDVLQRIASLEREREAVAAMFASQRPPTPTPEPVAPPVPPAEQAAPPVVVKVDRGIQAARPWPVQPVLDPRHVGVTSRGAPPPPDESVYEEEEEGEGPAWGLSDSDESQPLSTPSAPRYPRYRPRSAPSAKTALPSPPASSASEGQIYPDYEDLSEGEVTRNYKGPGMGLSSTAPKAGPGLSSGVETEVWRTSDVSEDDISRLDLTGMDLVTPMSFRCPHHSNFA
jgi:hypothetical protein